jgi:hypothetical protein
MWMMGEGKASIGSEDIRSNPDSAVYWIKEAAMF